MLHTLILIFAIVAIASLLLWAINQFPIDPIFQKILRVGIVLVGGIWLIMILARLLGAPIG